MRVLLWMYEGEALPGGHQVQWDKTAEGLRQLGVEVQIHFGATARVEGFDVVHGYSLLPEQARACRLAGVPLALSTIHWSRRYRSNLTHRPWSLRGLRRHLRLSGIFTLATMRGRYLEKSDALAAYWNRQRKTFENAEILLPNSAEEAAQVVADFDVTTPQHVVPNAVDVRGFPLSDGPRGGVLYVGRIEPHKNQLGLIRALRGSGLPLTIMGPPHPHHPAYYEQCVREAGTEVKIVKGMRHEELGPYYARFKVHVLPSWFETTGLVSLEAALSGCNVVTTDRGYARSYLGDDAWYCDPSRPASIRNAIRAALAAPYRPALRERILQKYTWERTAEETLAGYEKIIRPRLAYARHEAAAATLLSA